MTRSRFALVAMMALASGALAREANAFQFGACVHLALNRSNAETVLSLARDAGFNSIRDDAYWSAIETTQGTLRLPEKYGDLGSAMRGMAADGGTPLLVLDFGNRFYDDGGLVTSDAGIAAFARYSRFMAESFKGSVGQFEVWNEWNSGFGSKPKVDHGDAADYVRLLAGASAAVKKGNPQAKVVGGVTSGVDLKWIGELIDAGGLAHLDALSVHSYTLFRFKKNPEGAVRSLDKLHDRLEKAEPSRLIPIYVTEMGWPTNTGKHGVTEREAAEYLVRFMMLVRSRPWVQGVWWYDLIDDGDSNEKVEHRFGLVARDKRLKPAFVAAREVSRLVLPQGDVKSYRLAAGGYFVTGSNGEGRWAVGWSMEKDFLGWADGVTSEPAAADDLEKLSSQLPEDGFPALFRYSGGSWRIVKGWADASVSRAKPPFDVRVQAKR